MSEGVDLKLDILKKAIIMEIAGLQFFLTAAEKTTSKKVREMFRQLAEDEVEHKNILEKMMKKMSKGGMKKMLRGMPGGGMPLGFG